MNSPIERRQFIRQVAGGTLAAGLGLTSPLGRRRYKGAIIGYTAHGNYGHGHDLDFNDHPSIEVVAVADPDPAGRLKAQRRSRAARGYADYREMLEKERPDLVIVATRWSALHYPRVRAALEIGAHVFCEKPFTETLAQADQLLARAERGKRKIAVAHQIRVAPGILFLKRRIGEGVIGELLELRLRAKDDRRAGGEDMIVLGIHEFNLARYFADGGPNWCSARVAVDGREVSRGDIHPASEGDGLVVGNQIDALFAFPRGLNVHFSSDARYFSHRDSYTMELIGDRGRVHFSLGFNPTILVGKRTGGADGETDSWEPLAGDPTPPFVSADLEQREGNRRVVDDWLAAIENDREPAISGRAGMETLEMAHAVFAAGMTRGRVAFPLADRRHPLAV